MTAISKIIISASLLLGLGSMTTVTAVSPQSGQMVCGKIAPAATTSSLMFQPTDVVYKADDGIVRIKGKLVGRPHTSDRIDGASLTINGRKYAATDIDGVDFERYFQWEDDGVIPIEIDFELPKGKLPKVSSKSILTLKTVRGELKFKASNR